MAGTFSLETDSMKVLFAICHADWINFPKCAKILTFFIQSGNQLPSNG